MTKCQRCHKKIDRGAMYCNRHGGRKPKIANLSPAYMAALKEYLRRRGLEQ